MENALNTHLEITRNILLDKNNFKALQNKDNLNSNKKIWQELIHEKIDIFNFNYVNFLINKDEIDSDLNKYPMKNILSELLKKRNSKACTLNKYKIILIK